MRALGTGSTILLTGLIAVYALSDTGPSENGTPTAKVGERIANVSFADAAGRPKTLHGLADRKALVVAFLSFDCPVCTGYCQTLAELARTYAGRGVGFLGVIVGDDVHADAVARQARELGLPFPVVPDARGAAARALAASVTPEVFVLDGALVLRYRGRIDDRYAARLQPKTRIGRHDLRLALEDVLAGKAVQVAATQALGCPIAAPVPSARGKVTYHRDVLPILQQKCQGCHRPGDVGPFSLLTYRQALRWGRDIKEFTANRKMPPWKPTDGPGFLGDRRLTEREIATLAAWVDGGMAEGEPRDAPAPRKFQDGWQLGKPDLVLTVPGDFELGPGGADLYRCFVLPTDLPEDKYVSAVEVRPGNRRVMHHALLFIDRHGHGRRLEEQARKRAQQGTPADRGPGYSLPLSLAFLPGFLPTGALSGWAPGMSPRHLPDGIGYYLPKKADIVLQVHYHRSGRTEKDRTQVGLYFTRGQSAKRLQGLAVPASFIIVPAGARNYKVEGKVWVRQDCKLYAIMPHMHLLGKKIKVTMTPPGGQTRTLVAVADWDFNWQEDYFFREPIFAPAGTRFEVEGIYDNSDANPQNPFQPPRTILAGMETTNEMCVGFLGAVSQQRGLIRCDVGVRVPGVGWLPGGVIPTFGL